MELILVKRAVCSAIAAGVAATLVACGGGGGSDSSTTSGTPGGTDSTPAPGAMPLVVSDASSDDWATIGVRILSIALTPQGGGAPVTVYTAPTPAPMVNLEELDQIAEILGNASVPAGTYTGATLTISGNPGDVALVVSAAPEAGFAGTAGATIATTQIQIQGTSGASGSLTVPVNVSFVAPLVVASGQNNALDLEFDLSHPAFIIAHTPPSADGATVWAVNFNGPVRHHPVYDMRRLVLRHTYGTVTAVSSDNSTLTLTKDFPTLPVVNPETSVASTESLQVEADATNGTIFYDLDAKTTTTVTSFASEASSLVGKYVRIAARYQQNGTLVAVRVWSSGSFNNVWVSPEGHVVHVNPSTDVITVLNESGVGVPLTVNANTQFFFRQPQNERGCDPDLDRYRLTGDRTVRPWVQGARQCGRPAGCDAGGPEHRHRDRGVLWNHLGCQQHGIHLYDTQLWGRLTTTPCRWITSPARPPPAPVRVARLSPASSTGTSPIRR